MKRNISRHHMVPRSRGGPDKDWNILELTEGEHAAWHRIFNNKMPHEVLMEVLKTWTPKEMRRDSIHALLHEARKEGWL